MSKLCIPEAILSQHLVVLGKTGAGKSSALRQRLRANQIREGIRAHSVVLMVAHNDHATPVCVTSGCPQCLIMLTPIFMRALQQTMLAAMAEVSRLQAGGAPRTGPERHHLKIPPAGSPEAGPASPTAGPTS